MPIPSKSSYQLFSLPTSPENTDTQLQKKATESRSERMSKEADMGNACDPLQRHICCRNLIELEIKERSVSKRFWWQMWLRHKIIRCGWSILTNVTHSISQRRETTPALPAGMNSDYSKMIRWHRSYRVIRSVESCFWAAFESKAQRYVF